MLNYVTNEIKNNSWPERAQASSGLRPTDSQEPCHVPSARPAAKPGPWAPRGTGPLPCQAGSKSMCQDSRLQIMDRTRICSQHSRPFLFSFPANPDTCLFGKKEQEKETRKTSNKGSRWDNREDRHQLNIKNLILVLVDYNSRPSLPTPRQSLFTLSMFTVIWNQPGPCIEGEIM